MQTGSEHGIKGVKVHQNIWVHHHPRDDHDHHNQRPHSPFIRMFLLSSSSTIAAFALLSPFPPTRIREKSADLAGDYVLHALVYSFSSKEVN